jgi:hypothetical protein
MAFHEHTGGVWQAEHGGKKKDAYWSIKFMLIGMFIKNTLQICKFETSIVTKPVIAVKGKITKY